MHFIRQEGEKEEHARAQLRRKEDALLEFENGKRFYPESPLCSEQQRLFERLRGRSRLALRRRRDQTGEEAEEAEPELLSSSRLVYVWADVVTPARGGTQTSVRAVWSAGDRTGSSATGSNFSDLSDADSLMVLDKSDDDSSPIGGVVGEKSSEAGSQKSMAFGAGARAPHHFYYPDRSERSSSRTEEDAASDAAWSSSVRRTGRVKRSPERSARERTPTPHGGAEAAPHVAPAGTTTSDEGAGGGILHAQRNPASTRRRRTEEESTRLVDASNGVVERGSTMLFNPEPCPRDWQFSCQKHQINDEDWRFEAVARRPHDAPQDPLPLNLNAWPNQTPFPVSDPELYVGYSLRDKRTSYLGDYSEDENLNPYGGGSYGQYPTADDISPADQPLAYRQFIPFDRLTNFAHSPENPLLLGLNSGMTCTSGVAVADLRWATHPKTEERPAWSYRSSATWLPPILSDWRPTNWEQVRLATDELGKVFFQSQLGGHVVSSSTTVFLSFSRTTSIT